MTSSPYVDASVANLPDHCGYGDTTQAEEAPGTAQHLVQVRTGDGRAHREEPSRAGSVRSSHQEAASGDLTPYYADERATLYRGDALAVLRLLPDASVDAVITDPPYSSGGMVRGDRAGSDTKSKYTGYMGKQPDLPDFTGDNRDQRGYGYWCALWLGECLRIVKPGGVAMLFTDWRQLPTTTDALQAGGFVWRGIVPWYKPTSRPTSGRFTASCEYVAWGSAGPMPVDLTAGAFPGFYQASSPRDREHITQKPLEVMRSLVQIVPAGGVVLDPFAGSGTTGVAALIEGRRFVGAELTAHYAAVAVDRLRTAAMKPGKGEQADIFGELAS